MLNKAKHILYSFLNAVLNSYSVIFFSQNKTLALLLLFVTFFKPFAGLMGLVAVVSAIVFAEISGLNKQDIQKGLLSYNAMIVGIGMGTFYIWSFSFCLFFIIIIFISVIFSAVLKDVLGKRGLPFLSIPFVLCMWLVLLCSKLFVAVEFSTRNIYWINEMYAFGDQSLVNFVMFFENLPLPSLVAIFFKSLSSLFFQNNVLAGMIISLAILFHSRIMFLFILLGFITAMFTNNILMANPVEVNYYLMGGNYIMISVAIGCFFTIPSKYSCLWAVLSVAITLFVVSGITIILEPYHLPVYSLPFCLTTIVLLRYFQNKNKKGLVLTPLQLYSPEENLYSYLNKKERLAYEQYIRFQLPFLGQWMVSQGYDGNITHKGDWSKALDFIIVDEQLKTYSNFGLKVEDFYCYNKPIIAPANGFIFDIVDYIEDNEIGKINQNQNWGNTIIIKHSEYLFTKLSHLKQYSAKVKIGDYVRQGDIIGSCGNSGRSPEPHLHFQVQSTAYIGSKTLSYPISSFVSMKKEGAVVAEFKIPNETEQVSNLTLNESLNKAFAFLPGYVLEVSATNFKNEQWEVFTDAYNNSYFYCKQTESTAYFKRLENVFYFISFFGNEKSLLFYFYVSCYKINLSTDSFGPINDKFPLQSSSFNVSKWMQDIIAPFYIFKQLYFESQNTLIHHDFFNSNIEINSKQTIDDFFSKKTKSFSKIKIIDNKIDSIDFNSNHATLQIKCEQKI
jgi:urea transporter/murein DD-endopeptidase MepM/ murein hydrolase activator NlpD